MCHHQKQVAFITDVIEDMISTYYTNIIIFIVSVTRYVIIIVIIFIISVTNITNRLLLSRM